MSRVIACLALLLLLAIPALGKPPVDGDPVAELERVYLEALAKLFTWCRGVHLNATADAVARELLEFDPDHEKARRWFGYKQRHGRWVQADGPKSRKDRNRAAKKSYPARRRERVDGLVDRYWEVYEALQGEQAEADRRRLRAIAVDRWPQDARFRKAGGEVQRGGLWILEESARSDGVYERLRRVAKRLLVAAPEPAEAMPPPILLPFGLDWRGASRCGGITVVSATSHHESDRVAQHCAVAVKLFQLIFGVQTELPPDFTVALGSGEADYRKVLSNAGLPEAIRKRLQHQSGFTLQEPPLLFASPSDAAHRLDGAVRKTFDLLREKTFGDFGRLGWAREGFGTFLTWLVCGTRLSSFGALNVPTRSSTGRGASRQLGDSWCAGARRLATRGELPELTYLLAMDHDAMKSDHLLAAYAFAVYLVTGRPGQVQRFLSKTNNGRNTPDASREVLAMDLLDLEERFARWLEECH